MDAYCTDTRKDYMRVFYSVTAQAFVCARGNGERHITSYLDAGVPAARARESSQSLWLLSQTPISSVIAATVHSRCDGRER